MEGELPPVSVMLSSPPLTVGSPENGPPAHFATIFARLAGSTSWTCPRINSSAALAEVALASVKRSASPKPWCTEVRRICSSSLSVSWAGDLPNRNDEVGRVVTCCRG